MVRDNIVESVAAINAGTYNSETPKRFSFTFGKTLRSLSENAIAWEDSWDEEHLKEASAQLIDFWRPFLQNPGLKQGKDPLPKVAFGSERANAGLAQRPPQPLPEGALAEFAAEANKRRGRWKHIKTA
jgi:hypothetical protein